MKRLGKQRVETLQLLNAHLDPDKGWKNHPATRMWVGYTEALLRYQVDTCAAWVELGVINRGKPYNDTCADKSIALAKHWGLSLPGSFDTCDLPPWWGGDVHATHRSNLLRKDADHYGKFGWSEPDDLEYIWPAQHMAA